jgi:hypothetical protein
MGTITTKEYQLYCTDFNLDEIISHQKVFRVDAYHYSNRMSMFLRS